MKKMTPELEEPTSNIKVNDKTAQEHDISYILEKLSKKSNKNDAFFFKYILIEKIGCGLRHKIAHSLLIHEEYSIEIMYLLFIAFLKISKNSK